MIIKVDNREQLLLSEIKKREMPANCKILWQKLELGDIVICDNSDKEVLIY